MKSRIYWFLKLLFDSLFCPIALFAPRDKKTFLLGAWGGRQFSDNPKYFMLYLLEQTDARCIWIGAKHLQSQIEALDFPKSRLRFVEKKSFAAIWYFLTAGNLVCNIRWQNEILNLPLSSRVKIFNLWHGNGFKSLCYKETAKERGTVRQFLHNILVEWNEFLYPQASWTSSSSKESSDALILGHPKRFSRDRMINEGYSRNDYLLAGMQDDELMLQVKKKYASLLNIPIYVKWYLYMPTFRDWANDVFSFSTICENEALQKILTDQNAIIIEKHHPRILQRLSLSASLRNSVRIVSEAEGLQIDIQELLLVSNRMITDYSSCYTDFALMKRPVIHYAYDYETYVQQRGVNCDVKSVLAGPLVQTQSELFDSLAADDETLLKQIAPHFKDIIAHEHGHASEMLYKTYCC